MTGKERMYRAHSSVSYGHCFWGIDSMMYSEAFADRQLKEAEDNLVRVASEIIAETVQQH